MPKRGFTLIEVMVVVSIIGIFSVAAIVATSAARNKGNDAAIKLNLNSVKNQAEIYYSTIGNGKYGTQAVNTTAQKCDAFSSSNVVFGQSAIQRALAAARDASTGDWEDVLCSVPLSNASYAIAVKARGDGSTWYCLDSTKGITTLTEIAGIPDLGGQSNPARCP